MKVSATHIKTHTGAPTYRCSTRDYTCKDTSVCTFREYRRSRAFRLGAVRRRRVATGTRPERFKNVPLDMRKGFDLLTLLYFAHLQGVKSSIRIFR